MRNPLFDRLRWEGQSMRSKRLYAATTALLVQFVFSPTVRSEENPHLLSVEQQRDFLLNAEIIKSKRTGKGITNPYTLTLSDGTITHDASFQSVNERRNYKQLTGYSEINFVDSYLYNLAAYELARLLGLEDMLPVTVERKWDGKIGSLTWWLPVMMSEGERTEKDIHPPDIRGWDNSMHKVRVFAELIYDTDRNNPGNILIGTDWELYMVDFTRAFRLYHDLRNPDNLVRCGRELLEKLRALDSEKLCAEAGNYLTDLEIEGVMVRRDKIVAHFEKLRIARKLVQRLELSQVGKRGATHAVERVVERGKTGVAVAPLLALQGAWWRWMRLSRLLG